MENVFNLQFANFTGGVDDGERLLLLPPIQIRESKRGAPSCVHLLCVSASAPSIAPSVVSTL